MEVADVDTLSLKGTLVACEERPYQSFADRQTGERKPGGVTRWVHVVPDFAGEVVAVKVPSTAEYTPVWHELLTAGFGAQVAVVAALGARNNKIERRLLTVDVIAA